MKNILIIGGIAVLFLTGGVWWSNDLQNKKTGAQMQSGDYISQEGIHWHPEVSFVIKGEKQSIPANVGIGMQYAGYPQYDPMMMMTNIHTHDASGQLHWEVMEGPVKKEDVRLGQFFSIWGKKFTKECIFDNCNGTGGTVRFVVNGKENTEFENYLVKDSDKIEILYE